MPAQDQVTIDASSPHTTTLAQLSKEYAVLYDRWQSLTKQADEALTRAQALSDDAEKLKPEVDSLRERMRKALDA